MPESDVKLISSGPTFEIWRGAKGVMRLDWNNKGAVRMMVDGHGYAEFAAPEIRRWGEAHRQAPRAALLIDFFKMHSYDSQLRVDMQSWAAERKSSVDVFVLSTSKLVTMGVSVANLAVGGIIKAWSTRPEFDRECQRRGLPVNPPFSV